MSPPPSILVKVQVPLVTNGVEPMAMVYDQTRSIIHCLIPMQEEYAKRAGAAGKFYCRATPIRNATTGAVQLEFQPENLPNPGW